MYDNVNRVLRTAEAQSPWQHRGSGEVPDPGWAQALGSAVRLTLS